MSNSTHWTEDAKSKEENYKWNKVRPSKSGIYLIKGKFFSRQFNCETVLIDIENRVVILDSKNELSLDKMFKVEWMGPFMNKEIFENVREREIRRHNS
jgi:hypothetical protein